MSYYLPGPIEVDYSRCPLCNHADYTYSLPMGLANHLVRAHVSWTGSGEGWMYVCVCGQGFADYNAAVDHCAELVRREDIFDHFLELYLSGRRM